MSSFVRVTPFKYLHSIFFFFEMNMLANGLGGPELGRSVLVEVSAFYVKSPNDEDKSTKWTNISGSKNMN